MAIDNRVADDLVLGSSCLPRPRGVPQWFTGQDGERYLQVPWSESEQESYSPLEKAPLLHAELAKVDETEDSIAAFVSEYGWLGIHSRVTANDDWLLGESLADWRRVLRSYRVLWGAVAGKPELGVLTLLAAEAFSDSEARAWQRFYWWLATDRVEPSAADLGLRQLHDRSVAALAGLPSDDHGEWFRHAEPSSLLLPATEGVVRVPRLGDAGIMEGGARDRALAQALHTPLREGLGASLLARRDHSGFSLHFSPKSVLAAAYMQIAQDLAADDFRYEECLVCKRPYKPSKRSPGQRLCGRSKCRTAKYGQRRDEAYRLRTEKGLEPGAIAARMAQETGEPVTIRQVNGWIEAAAKRKGKQHGAEGAENGD